ncbi:hypothetical protein PAXRUDRAFT_185752 [Paxillus rubicundulus Ve08.2h10]|uniref:Uncharacterized protein n=1 Tax=Paxillus rubicundulus Ve08.2h10 TaxID=930991 RepID=A0A0D0DYT3_9AGAM|nr:hypothetical protein PAXRUDRAFT_185752 [Paxillus rubicundulus Ve08.2h10]
MSRRLTPYIFAGLLGAISGVYIFKPVLEEVAAAKEIRGATEGIKSPVPEHPPVKA